MSVQELKQAYDELPAYDRVLLTQLILADQMARDPEFANTLDHRHQAMDAGKKWHHSDLLALNEELGKRGL